MRSTRTPYLAIVSARPGAPLAPSYERNVFHIILSAAPDRLAENGWELAGANLRLLTPDAAVPLER